MFAARSAGLPASKTRWPLSRRGRCHRFRVLCQKPAGGGRAQARAIIAALPPFVTTVGLFVNASRCELNEILEVVPLDLLQFHGDETPQDCEGYHRPWIKALRVRPAMTWRRPASTTQAPAAFCWTPTCQACLGEPAKRSTGH
jgi:hypothetical protein